MKKQRNHSQLKDQANSPEGTNNETNLYETCLQKKKKKKKLIHKENRLQLCKGLTQGWSGKLR